MSKMKLDLRYCQKCKRNTLQVKQKVLSYEASRELGDYTIHRQSKDVEITLEEIKRQEAMFEQDTWYCPCCGKEWIEVEQYPPRCKVEEVKFPVIKREVVLAE